MLSLRVPLCRRQEVMGSRSDIESGVVLSVFNLFGVINSFRFVPSTLSCCSVCRSEQVDVNLPAAAIKVSDCVWAQADPWLLSRKSGDRRETSIGVAGLLHCDAMLTIAAHKSCRL